MRVLNKVVIKMTYLRHYACVDSSSHGSMYTFHYAVQTRAFKLPQKKSIVLNPETSKARRFGTSAPRSICLFLNRWFKISRTIEVKCAVASSFINHICCLSKSKSNICQVSQTKYFHGNHNNGTNQIILNTNAHIQWKLVLKPTLNYCVKVFETSHMVIHYGVFFLMCPFSKQYLWSKLRVSCNFLQY